MTSPYVLSGDESNASSALPEIRQDPNASSLPSGEYGTDSTISEWPSKLHCRVPVILSQTLDLDSQVQGARREKSAVW
ncbi:hypothetical protein ALT_9513 [Aspergillus lentulus]|uniref:Uncharacterized protein n=1 Tax=Aspergillus lentulus TaxID=293939 RepID=A0AAN4PSC2_ASPLE|nr:uncharacterized protein IFM58399_05557 [Aspergillus lentulus]KAF4160096.1 hypothetical protein CNMCM6069_009780 [Aspergillus lentulus]KAF4187888.1 hypothetical protein CNMCM7927_003095 [Aspergillus lentulus]GAQ12192.1 hypothetical protein ALT_9513 [Aspergillus lentulus]GFF39378.1 hypothetical protein IFM58399_05557 [Aspergillus lentulus]GFF61662.1 hypothetical protein IFM62136_05099 [Aspergillus lentulus]